MREIEVKILEIDKSAIEKKLRAFGAKKVFDGTIDCRYYDLPSRSLQKRGIVLRLRRKGMCGELTVKTDLKRTKGAKTAQELETPVSFELTRQILHSLGYRELIRTRKHRIDYALGAVHFEIDKLPGIPWFLEIEAPSQKALKAMVKALGFLPADAKPWWWADVVEHYRAKTARQGEPSQPARRKGRQRRK